MSTETESDEAQIFLVHLDRIMQLRSHASVEIAP